MRISRTRFGPRRGVRRSRALRWQTTRWLGLSLPPSAPSNERRSDQHYAAPEVAGPRGRLRRRQDLPPAIRIPARAFAVRRSARSWPGTGSAADRQARGRDPLDGGGGLVRRAAAILGRARDRHLFVGLPVRARREPGEALERIPG